MMNKERSRKIALVGVEAEENADNWCKLLDLQGITGSDSDSHADRKSNMHYLIPVFATLTPERDDVIKMSAMVEDYATALNRKDILHVRLKGITGDDNAKVLFTCVAVHKPGGDMILRKKLFWRQLMKSLLAAQHPWAESATSAVCHWLSYTKQCYKKS